ncbi:hypothetical protein M514_03670 [Trichuris suis]|uniref:Bromo domain-containing protein n=1 Tax=Trichuris suis TaxID=68888 RepID=A0A085NGQ3_9BILA|nr:hypothetical protein M514_03670 [Trichuris suis]
MGRLLRSRCEHSKSASETSTWMKTYTFIVSAPPKTVGQLWTLVNHIRCCNGIATLDDIVRKAEETFGWTRKDTMSYIDGCVDDHVLLRAADRVKNGYFYSIPMLPEEVPEKDIYCFNCHQLRNVRNCTRCFRAFHTECLPENFLPTGMLLLCPPCQAGSKLVNIPGRYSKIVQISPRHNHFVFIAHHMDLSIMSMKLENGLYWKLCEFLGDVEIMLHNVNIIYGCWQTCLKGTTLMSLSLDDSSIVKTAEVAFEEAKSAIAAWESKSMIRRGEMKDMAADLMLVRKRRRVSPEQKVPDLNGIDDQPTGSGLTETIIRSKEKRQKLIAETIKVRARVLTELPRLDDCAMDEIRREFDSSSHT